MHSHAGAWEREKLQKEIAEQHGYELHDHSLVLYVKPRQN